MPPPSKTIAAAINNDRHHHTLWGHGTAMRTVHLLNFLIKGMMDVIMANSKKIKGDQKDERSICGLVQEMQRMIFPDGREGQTVSQPKMQNLALRYQ